MKFKYLIFDLDGTILDSHEGLCRSFQSALKSYGIEESIGNIKNHLGPLLSETIVKVYGLSKEDGIEAMKLHRKRLMEKGIYECSVYEGIPEMLKTLKDYNVKLAIATNKPEEASVSQLKYFDLIKYFDVVVGNNWDENRGTKGEFIKMAMMEMKVNDISRVCMVGDRYNDIEGGKENGLSTIGLTYGYGSRAELEKYKPDYIVSSPMEICDIVLKKGM